MTIKLQIREGSGSKYPRYTFWNVISVEIQATQAIIRHSDRPDEVVQGFVESIKRIE